MFTNRKNKVSFLTYEVKNNLRLIGVLLFVFSFLFLLYAVSNYNGIYYYGQSYCLADAYVWFLKPRAYGILVMPFILILFTNFTKNDQLTNVLIRLETGRNWLRRKLIKGVFLSFVVTPISMIIVTFISSFQVKEVINWNSKFSIYYAITDNLNGDVQINEVIVLAFITMFIRNLYICLAAIVLKMKLHNDLLTFLLIAIISVFEVVQKKVPLFYRFINMDYFLWEDSRVPILYFSYTVIMAFIFALIMYKAIKKGEWVYER